MKADSLSRIFNGFQKLSQIDQSEYLKYFALVVERTRDMNERNKLLKFLTKLEKINGGQKSKA